jgi:hypothetical protein
MLVPAIFIAGLPTLAQASAFVTLYNRSDYEMSVAVWEDGESCTGRRELPANTDLNLKSPSPISLSANQVQAIGVGIFQMKGKSPVHCEYIHTLSPAAEEH